MTSTAFKPMKGEKAPADLSKLVYPLLASPKLDGIRCVKRNGQCLSSKLKLIPNEFIRKELFAVPNGFDGELLLKDKDTVFNNVSSAVMSRKGEPDFYFGVFDDYSQLGGFHSRLNAAHQIWLRMLPQFGGRVNIIEHRQVDNAEQLQHMLDGWIALGYEGAMVRSFDGPYKHGKSTVREGWLLKIKNFDDEEAEIIGVEEMMHNTNEAILDALGHAKRSSAKEGKVGKGTLGKFICRFLNDGTEFKCGTGKGLTQALRKQIWNSVSFDHDAGQLQHDVIGSIIKVKYQSLPGGEKRPEGEAPRIPLFDGFRKIEIDG